MNCEKRRAMCTTILVPGGWIDRDEGLALKNPVGRASEVVPPTRERFEKVARTVHHSRLEEHFL
jgi:hypothetical protein